MTQIDEILDRIVELLEASPSLSSVKKWHKVDGMIPAVHPCGSVSPVQEDFELIAKSGGNNYKTTTRFVIYVYLQHANSETGEQQIRELAHNVRLALPVDKLVKVNNVLGGHIYSIRYMTIDASSTSLLHAAEINLHVNYVLD
ncbi:MAG: hypothetical protein C4589_11295 [Peptococcaceae bacterium]|jgi:hypothetical protein|nr:MAG: hypothetical protein C4589_11295 [Peptococcaceae bacterium]